MKKCITNSIYTVAALSVLSITGCQKENFTAPEVADTAPKTEERVTQSTANLIPGQAYIKVNENGLRSLSNITVSLRSALRAAADEVKLTPIFDVSGPYEARMREAGLHRWMKVEFPEDIPVSDALESLKNTPGVDFAEGSEAIYPAECTYTPVPTNAVLRADEPQDGFNNGYKFTDPFLKYQWHYQNEGNSAKPAFVAGADINLFKAWAQETGKPNVIVGVIDSGIWGEHPDLKESLWDNPEKPGTYGYNFYGNTDQITAGYHGTHVSGTIAARNNNGVGVCGVAGGNGERNSGVRLMSLQIFKEDENGGTAESKATSPENVGKAFVWAANHGATIINCSWGYPPEETKQPLVQVIKEGIDYFIKNAGMDKDGKTQKADSPMAGGVVFFAAGNASSMDKWVRPSYYDEVIAVGAFMSNTKMTKYSDSGEWVDITAPGGSVDNQYEEGILSTISPLFHQLIMSKDIYGRPTSHGKEYLFKGMNEYAYAQGTSMATPHVTGIAALILSKYGTKPGFTSADLKKRLLSSLRDVDHVAVNDKKYKGKIGAGYIDAAAALEDDNKEKPAQVKDIKVEADYFNATIKWNITEDKDASTGYANYYDIYFNDKEFSKPETTLLLHTSQANNTAFQKEMNITVRDLHEGTTYYVGIIARDRWGNASEMVVKSFTTPVNGAPVIDNLPKESLKISSVESFKKVTLNVSDPENHSWVYRVGELPKGVSVKRNGEKALEVTIYNVQGIGRFGFDIMLTDQLGKSVSYPFLYEVVRHSGPQTVKNLSNLSFMVGDKPVEISIADTYQVALGLSARYSAISSDSGVVEATVVDDKLVVTPKGKGIASVTVTANDGIKSSRNTFEVSVADANSSIIRAIYPMPVHTYVKVLTSSKASEIAVTVTSMKGETVIKGTYPVDKQSSSITVETARLAPGVYHLTLNADGKTEKRTLVKN